MIYTECGTSGRNNRGNLMSKYVFVGDIHGKVEQVERALAMDGKKIFVGDFMDSFDRPASDHAKCVTLVLDAIEADHAEAIYGNHELSYLKPAQHMCSGYNLANRNTIYTYKSRIERLFKSHLLLAPEFLVTHAGLTHQIWHENNLTVENLDAWLSNAWQDLRSPVHAIGLYRGGYSSVGGTFWCDWNAEFDPVPGLKQVFGHTAGKGIRQNEQSFCIDCLDHTSEFLIMDIDE